MKPNLDNCDVMIDGLLKYPKRTRNIKLNLTFKPKEGEMSEVEARSPNMTAEILKKWVEATVMPIKITDIYEADTNYFYVSFSRQPTIEHYRMVQALGFKVNDRIKLKHRWSLQWIPPVDDEY